MADRQLLAKLGVVVLLGLNVGAYYLLWPKSNGRPIEHSEPARPMVPTPILPTAPQHFPVAAAHNAVPVSAPSVPVKNEKPPETDDAVSRLLDLIKKESVQPIPVVDDRIEVPTPIPLPPEERRLENPPARVPDPKPQPLPPLKADPISDSLKITPDPIAPIGTTLAQKNSQSLWLVNVTQSGAQTLVTATLRRATPAQLHVEFKILCDRVEQTGSEGLQALGHITFVGAGIKGACQRLTVPWNSPSVIFEEQVRITPKDARGLPSPSSQIRGERIVWEQPASEVDVNAAEFRPAGVSLPEAPPPGGLGMPK